MQQPEPPAPGKRKWLVWLVVLIIVVGAIVGGILGAIYLIAPSLRVQTTQSFATAAEPLQFTAVLSLPPLTSAGAIDWNFGDGNTATSQGTVVNHTYQLSGTFFVAASSGLSNGRRVDNFGALYPIYVGAPRDLTDRDSLGVIAINTSASSPGAPLIPPGGKIVANGSVQQEPTYFLSTQTNATTWVNYTWAVKSLTFDFGDGSPTQSNTTAPPFTVVHTYANPGIYTLKLTVVTRNMTTVETVNPSSSIGPIPVIPEQTRSTTVAQTIAVGNYKPVTYAGSTINPDLIVNQEAVTGGFTSLDPAIDYESVGFEIIANVYQQLLWYNGTKTDQFVPVLADRVPSVADGSISADHMNYTFHIRPGIRYADASYGNVTAWDVKYSITRTMLFEGGHPGTNGWLLSQYLVPDYTNSSQYTFDNINKAITVDNASQTVTFHLVKPTAELPFFQVIADPLGGAIVSSRWLDRYQPLTWTPAGFESYKAFGNLVNYNDYTRKHTMGTGPYMIDYIVPGEAVALVRNPNFTPTPGIPAPSVSRVYIQYVGEASTRELSLESGKADIASIATSRFDNALRMERNGLVKIIFFPTLNLFWWNFNLEIASSSANGVPPDFFVDINMRKAFAYAFDYDNYINQIVGNAKFGARFADKFAGIIPNGMIGYENLTGQYDIYNMTLAKQFYAQTEWVRSHGGNPNDPAAGFTLTIVVPTADPVDKAAARAWGDQIQTLGAGITINVQELSFSDIIAYSAPHANPMAIYFLGWLPDFPFPTDYTFPMLMPSWSETPNGGTYPVANGFSIPYLKNETAKGVDQAAQQLVSAQKIANWINISLTSADVNQIVSVSRLAQREFSNLTLYVYAQQQFAFFVYRTWLSGLDQEENPMLGGADLLYNLLSKPRISTATLGTAGFQVDGLLAETLQAPLLSLVGLATRIRLRGA